ncbi:MAG: hypothetical protein HQL81_04840 [Magnetococcales bacterium]|nr:hypothetical protein [Magnetococcales bacterium]
MLILILFFTRPITRSDLPAWFLREDRAGASLGLPFFAVFAKKGNRIAGSDALPPAMCPDLFAKTAKRSGPRLAPARFPAKTTRKTASGNGARKKQNQHQNQHPGGNPPDPFFLLIFI